MNWKIAIIACIPWFLSSCATGPKRNFTGLPQPRAYGTIMVVPSAEKERARIVEVNGVKTRNFNDGSHPSIVDVRPGRTTCRITASETGRQYSGVVSFNVKVGKTYRVQLVPNKEGDSSKRIFSVRDVLAGEEVSQACAINPFVPKVPARMSSARKSAWTGSSYYSPSYTYVPPVTTYNVPYKAPVFTAPTLYNAPVAPPVRTYTPSYKPISPIAPGIKGQTFYR